MIYNYDIINAHCHVYPKKVALRAAENIGAFYGYPVPEFAGGDAGTLEALLDEGSKCGVTGYCVSGAATVPGQVKSVNDFFISLNREDCGTQLYCFGTAHPGFENVADELSRIRSEGLLGIKLHPDCQTFNIDDPDAYTIYEAAQALGLNVLMHLGDERHDYSSPLRLQRVCKDFPGLRFIAAHLGGYRDWDNGLMLKGFDNVWFDTCSAQSVLSPERLRNQIRTFGSDRCFFGTDYPIWNTQGEIDAMLGCGLTDSEFEMIFAGNFKVFIKETIN